MIYNDTNDDEESVREQGSVSQRDVYGFSKVTGAWYRVTDYEKAGDGKIIAKQKEEVSREDVPQIWIDAIDEEVYADAE